MPTCLKHFKGVVTYSDGSVYRGQWKDGEKHGFGNYTYNSGSRYVGDYREGMKASAVSSVRDQSDEWSQE